MIENSIVKSIVVAVVFQLVESFKPYYDHYSSLPRPSRNTRRAIIFLKDLFSFLSLAFSSFNSVLVI